MVMAGAGKAERSSNNASKLCQRSKRLAKADGQGGGRLRVATGVRWRAVIEAERSCGCCRQRRCVDTPFEGRAKTRWTSAVSGWMQRVEECGRATEAGQ